MHRLAIGLGLLLLLTQVAAIEVVIKLSSYDKQCFYEILRTHLSTQSRNRSTRWT